MSFLNECYCVLRKSNKDMIVVHDYSGINYSLFVNSDTSTFCKKLTSFPIDFTNYYFYINSNDDIYGIFNDTKINIVKFNTLTNEFNTLTTIEYDYKNFSLNFPYIYILDNDIHIIYYLTNKSYPTTVLFHHYRHNNKWIENKIDFINTPILDNFTVFFNNDTPTIFYLKDINGVTQILSSVFNISTCTWSTPIQITNSVSNKVYLSIVKDYLNFYHVAFSESHKNGYCVTYINGYLNSDSFKTTLYKSLNKPSDSSFTTLIKHEDTLRIMWVENKILYTSTSCDLGNYWSDYVEDEFSMSNKFIRSYFKSNYRYDLDYNCSSIFIAKDDISILGFDK